MLVLFYFVKRSSTQEIFCSADFIFAIFCRKPHPYSSANIPQANKPHANDLDKKNG